MIPVVRGPEPDVLSQVRAKQLALVRALGRPPKSEEVSGYRVVAESLWRAQKYKCCYCEHKVKKGYNDVEHYRPKARADRKPGSDETHGYWWLAFTWDNLLFACPDCNRSSKNDRFPVEAGSVSLVPEQSSPGHERPLLIDPSDGKNPVELIGFVETPIVRGGPAFWCARPRNGNLRGAVTIEVLDLNSQDLLELRTDHVRTFVNPFVTDLRAALQTGHPDDMDAAFNRAMRLLAPGNVFVGVTYDALRAAVPSAELSGTLGKSWPLPASVGL